jgi:plastocyanin
MHPRLALLTTLVVAAACQKQTPLPAGPHVVVITATDYAFGAPDTIVAGLTTFKLVNQGKEPHQAVIVGASDHSFAELEAGAMGTDPRLPDWLVFPAGPGVAVGGDSSNATAQVAPGNYLIVCFIPSPDGQPHVAKGMVRRLVVTPAPAGAVTAAEPAADVTVMMADYSFTLSAPLTAGTHAIRVENRGPQVHELAIEQLAAGKTLVDWQRWAAAGAKGMGPSKPLGGFIGPNVGAVGWVTVTLTPGRYLLTCYVPDPKDGKPHVMHGMVQEITVS